MDAAGGAVFLGLALLIAAVGVGLGMLIAPRLTRLAERDDEEESDDRAG